MTRSSVPLLAGAGLVLALLTGCVGEPAPSTGRPSGSASPSETGGGSATETPESPNAAPAPTTSTGDEVTCENVLADEDAARLEADGLAYRADRSEPFGPAAADLAADGGLSCTWLGSGDVGVWFTILSETDAAWQDRAARLESADWVRTDYPLPGALEAPPDYDPSYVPVIVHADGVTYLATSADFLTSLAQPG
ncbi:hypothetical protein [Agromyces sp. ZXT2-6]|uniref:hypothetical protein n=1 Tax=Agromyces sp. ZXT2-6 TaxID=3461153 RepID=UPI004055006B